MSSEKVEPLTEAVEGPCRDIEWHMRGMDPDRRAAFMDALCERLCAWPAAPPAGGWVREAAIRECIGALSARVEREPYGHAKAAVTLDIEALESLLAHPAAREERGE